MKKITIEIDALYGEKALISEIPNYLEKALRIAGEGNEVILTGAGPIWLYLLIAHALHGKAAKLSYLSPVTGTIEIFDHTPY